jgi:hypothetical protein
MILRVRFALPKDWKPVLGYADLERKAGSTPVHRQPTRAADLRLGLRIRRAKLPDPARHRQRRQLFQEPHASAPSSAPTSSRRDPKVVHYHLHDGSCQAGRWLVDRRLRLEGQDAWAKPASTKSRPWCWSTAARGQRYHRRRGHDPGAVRSRPACTSASASGWSPSPWWSEPARCRP